jgi:pyruvate/2-oxoglutarate dehydrogenase complex dihydrolipoamide dehydrogenase (E3) component
MTNPPTYPLIVIGGGAATGCQLAAIFNAFGSAVTVLDVAPRILAAEDSLVAQAMTEAFGRRGIDVVAGIGGIEGIERAGKELALVYRMGDGVQTVAAEAVMLSTGWLGNLDGLNLPAAGVATDGRYGLADETSHTSAPHIFACGDIDGRIMLVQSAGYEARIAAENAVLGGAGRKEYQIVPHGGFTNPEYASVGPTEEQARQQRDVVVAVVPYADLDRAVIDGRTEGFRKLIVDRETHRLVGAQVVGEQALEIVHVAAAGMAAARSRSRSGGTCWAGLPSTGRSSRLSRCARPASTAACSGRKPGTCGIMPSFAPPLPRRCAGRRRRWDVTRNP